MRRVLSLLLSCLLLLPLLPQAANAVCIYPDVPAGNWAESVILKARDSGLLAGNPDGTFGFGKPMTRAEFVTVLCRMFSWEPAAAGTPSFSDLGGWFDGYIETALTHDVFDKTECFRPRDPATRREMAVMLVRALGLSPLARQAEASHLPFKDVTDDAGYIAVAYDVGIINGMTADTFAPESGANREHAAAMLMRAYDKYNSKIGWLHGFYAFSSYSQKELAGQMNAVSFSWSRMDWDGATATLNTGSSGSNEWRVPLGYESITEYLETRQVHTSLSVFMSAGAKEMLALEAGRKQAAAAIAAEASRTYDVIGKSPYSGVTIDFEGLYQPSKADFVAFLTELRAVLPKDLTLYCAVQPTTADGDCFDGYDYRAIGELCDKVILMAHDYSPVSLAGMEGTSWQYNTAPAPLDKIYDSLRSITDPETGVQDRSKLALALSLGCEGWYVDGADKVISDGKLNPAMDTAHKRLEQADTVYGFQPSTGCAWMNYSIEDGRRVFLWYENENSVTQKLLLARMFGVTGVSLWRVGTIPDYEDWSVWKPVTQHR